MTFLNMAVFVKDTEVKTSCGEFLRRARAVPFFYALMLLLVLWGANGCGGEASPTTPIGVRNIQERKAVTFSRATLHAILVVDTNASGNVGDALQRDLDSMSHLVDSIERYTAMRVNKLVFSGNKATKAMAEQAIEKLSVEPDDVILFYFSGHGGRVRSTRTQWPDMYLQNAFALNLYDVFNRLDSKGGRLLLALSDSCNVTLNENSKESFTPFLSLRNRSEGYRKLFLEKRGSIIASSSLIGEFSYMQPKGSLFTRQFLQAFSQEVSSALPDWDDLMDAATCRISTSGVQQQPQYAIY